MQHLYIIYFGSSAFYKREPYFSGPPLIFYTILALVANTLYFSVCSFASWCYCRLRPGPGLCCTRLYTGTEGRASTTVLKIHNSTFAHFLVFCNLNIHFIEAYQFCKLSLLNLRIHWHQQNFKMFMEPCEKISFSREYLRSLSIDSQVVTAEKDLLDTHWLLISRIYPNTTVSCFVP